MQKLLLAITAALAVVAAVKFFSNDQVVSQRFLGQDLIKSAWDLWKQAKGRSYGTDSEESYRFMIFTQNYHKIAAFNASAQTSTVALNKFADLSQAEFKAQYTGVRGKTVKGTTQIFNSAATPDSYDARDDNLVNPVKNQGQCGSCWAFSVVGAMEGQRAKAGLGLDSFSEQMLVDCAPAPNQGCNGGLMDVALRWVVENPLASESAYPYTAMDGTCSSAGLSYPGEISAMGNVSADNSQIRSAIYQKGAVSVGIEADQAAFQFYNTGVITSGCGDQIDHGVTGIGYGNEDGSDYFLIRNSWGADWGMAGYVKIAPNQCGVMESVTFATA